MVANPEGQMRIRAMIIVAMLGRDEFSLRGWNLDVVDDLNLSDRYTV